MVQSMEKIIIHVIIALCVGIATYAYLGALFQY